MQDEEGNIIFVIKVNFILLDYMIKIIQIRKILFIKTKKGIKKCVLKKGDQVRLKTGHTRMQVTNVDH